MFTIAIVLLIMNNTVLNDNSITDYIKGKEVFSYRFNYDNRSRSNYIWIFR